MGVVKKFLVTAIVNALGLYLTSLIVAGVSVKPYSSEPIWAILTYVGLGAVFGIVNGVIGTAIRIVAFPLYLLTLGLAALIVNGLLFLLVAGISNAFGFGLVVDGFWWGVLGALVMAIICWVIGLITTPLFLRAGDDR